MIFRMILVLAGLVLWSGCFQNLRPQLGQGCDADASENTCGDGYQCVFIDSLQDGRCVPQSQDAQDINEAFSEALDGTSDGKETADAGGADGSGEGQSDGTPVADAGSADGSGEGQSDGIPVADAGSADGSGEGQSDGTSVADAGSADGSGEGQSDGTPVADAGSADGAGDGAETPDAGVGCPACAAHEVCDPDTNTCVDCLSNSECSDADVCDTEAKTCVECLSNDNCPANQVCNTTEQACVNCFDSMHCGDNETCNMDSFVCECAAGYDDEEEGLGCQDVNECEEEEPCFDDQENPPTCINTIGGYECRSCDNGYVVPDSGIGACEPAPFPSNADCTETDQAVTCTCITGYTGNLVWNSSSAQWNDSCSEATHPANTECMSTNSSGEIGCVCAEGYSGAVTWNAGSSSWNSTCALAAVVPTCAPSEPNIDDDVTCTWDAASASAGISYKYRYLSTQSFTEITASTVTILGGTIDEAAATAGNLEFCVFAVKGGTQSPSRCVDLNYIVDHSHDDDHDFNYPCLDNGQRLRLTGGHTLTTPADMLNQKDELQIQFAIQFTDDSLPENGQTVLTIKGTPSGQTTQQTYMLKAKSVLNDGTTTTQWSLEGSGNTMSITLDAKPSTWQDVTISQSSQSHWTVSVKSLSDPAVTASEHTGTLSLLSNVQLTMGAASNGGSTSQFFLNYLFIDEITGAGASLEEIASYVFDAPVEMEGEEFFAFGEDESTPALTANSGIDFEVVCCEIEDASTTQNKALSFENPYALLDLQTTALIPVSNGFTMSFVFQPNPEEFDGEEPRQIFATTEAEGDTPQLSLKWQPIEGTHYKIVAGLEWEDETVACGSSSFIINQAMASSPIRLTFSYGEDPESGKFKWQLRRNTQIVSAICDNEVDLDMDVSIEHAVFGNNEDGPSHFLLDTLRVYNSRYDLTTFGDMNAQGDGFHPQCFHGHENDCPVGFPSPVLFTDFDGVTPQEGVCGFRIETVNLPSNASRLGYGVNVIDGPTWGQPGPGDGPPGFTTPQTVGGQITDTFVARIPSGADKDTHLAWGLNVAEHPVAQACTGGDCESIGYFPGIGNKNGNDDDLIIARVSRDFAEKTFHYTECDVGMSAQILDLAANTHTIFAVVQIKSQSSGGSSQFCQIFNDDGSTDSPYSLYQGYHLLAVSNSGTVTIANINNLIEGINGLEGAQLATHNERIIAALHTSNVGGHLLISQGDDYASYIHQTLNETNTEEETLPPVPTQIAVAGNQMWLAGLLGTSEGNYTGKFVRRYDITQIEDPDFSHNFAINNVSDTPKALVAVNEDTAFLATVTGGQQLKLGAVKIQEDNYQPIAINAGDTPIFHLRDMQWNPNESRLHLAHFTNDYGKLMLASLHVPENLNLPGQVLMGSIEMVVGGAGDNTPVRMCMAADENDEMSPVVTFTYTGSNTTVQGIAEDDIDSVTTGDEHALIVH